MNEQEKIKAFPVLCYTRTCGWYVPKENMNIGKIAEVRDRKMYKIKTNE